MVGLARWFRRGEKLDAALKLFRRAIDKGLRDDLMFRTLWDIALLERKLGNEAAAIEVWTDLASGRNPYRTMALEEMAKHYEHRERNYAMALEFTIAALGYEWSAGLQRRRERLEGKLSRRAAAGRLL